MHRAGFVIVGFFRVKEELHGSILLHTAVRKKNKQDVGGGTSTSLTSTASILNTISKGACIMTIAQNHHRLLALVIFFAILAILLLSVMWFEGSQLLNGFWHSIHGLAGGIAV